MSSITTPEPEAPAVREPSAAEAAADALFEAEAAALAESPPRRPTATYRLQMHKGFRLADAAAIVDYLDALGVSDLYLSPYLEARPGSTHGYDVFDHAKINPEIGSQEGHAALIEQLARRGMGRVLDIVPNHMGVAGHNRFWLDMLETGPQAPSARFFDVDWHPVKEELEGRVLLPILGDQYGKVLESGDLKLELDDGAFYVRYYETRLPVAPRSYATILDQRPKERLRRFDPQDEHVSEYLSIADAARNLPSREVADAAEVEHKLREKEVIKRRIRRLCAESPDLCAFLDENVRLFHGQPGDAASFDRLHRLLEEQAYRLAYWRVAAEEINYRRFFDINDLAGLRMEDPIVFEAVHELIFRWVDEGDVTGLRIDHPDGLADPLGYFRRLQERSFLGRCRRRFEADQGDGLRWEEVEPLIRERFRRAVEGEPASPLARHMPVVVEKILSRGEDLPDDWPVDGTVGYGYLNAINGLFVDPAAADAVEQTYAEFTGDRMPPADVLYNAKLLICRVSLASEINMLARQLNRVSESDRRSRDFTLNDLRNVIIEVVACFPVYRTYIRPGEPVTNRDRGWIEQAVARARRRNPNIDATVFEFIRDALLLEHPEGVTDDDCRGREAFVRRFQQTTGPVQAKGLEDTAFYRQVKLASLNEVGGDPTRFGTSPPAFHAVNAHRLSRWPGSLGTTATHDTKRGEDTRVRIDAITERMDDWKTHLNRWSYWNARKKIEVNESPAPDAREEYLLYQILVGSWPMDLAEDAAVPEEYVGRVQQYMLKAVREAKVNTTWTDTDPSYSDAISKFVAEILTGPDAGPFLKDLVPFARRLARVGRVHSLAQALIKVTSPGVPDVYQGCDLWDFSLVDPDNRRPVDYDLRRRLLGSIRGRLDGGMSRRDLARALFAAPDDGAIKLYVLWTALNHRRADPALYAQGAYRPLDDDGERKGHLLAFARHREGRTVVAVAPRLVAGLMGEDAQTPPIGDAWGDTRLIAPDVTATIPRRWRDLLTDKVVEVQDIDGRPALPIATLFETLPLALLVDESA